MRVRELPQIDRKDLLRINVVGVSGSGKSTLAKRLAERLAVPHLEMDRLYWGPDWTEPNVEMFRERVSAALARRSWVLDGNYDSKTRDLKWTEATLVVWLDMPLLTTVRQAVGRAVRRAWTQDEIWPGTGNRESFRRSFLSSDSVVLWTLTSYTRVRKRYAQCAASGETGPPFLRLCSHRQIRDFVDHVDRMVRLSG